MEILDLLTQPQKTDTDFPINFPDKSLLSGLVTDQQEHLGAHPNESRRIWVDGGFLHGYLHLFKMQYDETLRILRLLEHNYDKEKKAQSGLMKEIKRLNDTLEKMQRTNEQLTLDFKTLRTRVESTMKRQEPILQHIEGQSNEGLHLTLKGRGET